MRGGGGNFGVVTSFEYRLHNVGPIVDLGLFFAGIDQGAAMLRFAREFGRALPRDAAMLIVGLNAPPEPFVPEEYRLQPGYAVVLVSFGSADCPNMTKTACGPHMGQGNTTAWPRLRENTTRTTSFT